MRGIWEPRTPSDTFLAVCLSIIAAGSAIASPYGDAVTADSPVAWYHLDETAGFLATNSGSAGATLDGSYLNFGVVQPAPATQSTMGVNGPRLGDLSGSSLIQGMDAANIGIRSGANGAAPSFPAQVEVPDNGLLDITGALTLEAWVYRDPQAVSGNNEGIVGKFVGNIGGVSQSNRSYELYYNPRTTGTGALSIGLVLNTTGASGGNVDFSTLVDLPLGSSAAGGWTYLAAVYEPGVRMSVYMNGVSIGEKTTDLPSGDLFNSTAPLWIGRQFQDTSSATSFEGGIDEVAVYNTALSPERILAHYQAAVPSTPPVPVGQDQHSFYSGMIASAGSKGYWRLGETGGLAAAEASGNASLQGIYHQLGTDAGAGNLAQEGPRPVDNFPGFAATNHAPYLNGSTNYVSVANTPDVDITGALTMEAWIKLDTIPTQNGGIIAKYLGTGEQRSYNLYVNGQGGIGGLAMAISPDGTFASATTIVDDVPLPTGEWAYVVGTFEPNQAMRLYINGVLAEELTTGIPSQIFSSTADLWIGRQFNDQAGNRLPGLVDEVALYDRALTAAEISAHYAAATTPLLGDANYDGVVNIFDINLVSAHWNEAGPVGDANFDGVVNIFDINLISAHWNEMAGGGARAVPEPASCVLATLASGGLLLVRRRRGPLSNPVPSK
jgi:Concanavalin A-like lectin/glucanases superfamily